MRIAPDDRDRLRVVRSRVSERERGRDDRDHEHDEHEQHRRVVGQPATEAHDAVLGPPRSRDDGEPEHEERVREQRAEDRRLRDDDLPGPQREDRR
jgi:hypothetical protein